MIFKIFLKYFLLNDFVQIERKYLKKKMEIKKEYDF